MNKETSRNIVRGTFQGSFDKDGFIHFLKELLNKFDEASFVYRGNTVPKAFQSHILTLERIGKYSDGENEIDLLIAKLKSQKSLDRARTMQRNLIAWYLNGSRGGKMKDAALVAFVAPNEDDWRFSLVKMDYKFEEGKSGKIRVKEDFTPARRWSFLVGKNENSHTAQAKLAPIVENDIHNPTIKQLEEAFNIEKVTKEFFEKYRELFLKVKENLDAILEKDSKIKKDFKEKDINTVDFSKKLLGQIVFLYFLQKKGWFGVSRGQDWGEGDKQYLRTLFNASRKEKKNYFNKYLEPLFYEALRVERPKDYYDKFECRIPFLNGGLFDPINDYDWQDTDLVIPDDLFSNNYKTKEGDKGNGILDVFDRYNFTVKEDEPLEKEVAVDPEMLGKVFENLLEVKDRKSRGTYYTPREIVHYMCEQSLINYLSTGLGNKVSKEDMETFIHYGETLGENENHVAENGGKFKLPESIWKNANLIDEKLADIKICDPAIGSGAFPVGMMTEIIKARNGLSSYIKDNKRNIYNFKRDCIQNSLYGVDVDPSAVEIAKLRLWLSLVVDEDDIKEIKPLPNLDYKIMCGNSLLGIEKNLFNMEALGQLERLKPLYFNETSHSKKAKYKEEIDKVISLVTNNHSDFDFEIYFSEVFDKKGGFDVVMANPPYVRIQNLSHEEIDFYKKKFKSAYKRLDISILFIEKALSLMGDSGHSTYITTSQFTKTEYGKKIRTLLLPHLSTVIYFGDNQIFESATNYTSLFFFGKNQNESDLNFVNSEPYSGALNLSEFIKKNNQVIPKEILSDDAWELDNLDTIQVLDKIRNLSKRTLSTIATVEYGVVTGSDKVLVLQQGGNTEIEKSPLVYPLLKPKNLDKYMITKANHYVIYPYESRGGKTMLVSEEKLSRKSSLVYQYLLRQKEDLLNRKDSRRVLSSGRSEHWYALIRHSSFEKVSKDKILTPALSKHNEFCLDREGRFFTGGSIYSIVSKDKEVSNFSLLGLLNSRLAEYYFRLVCPIRQHGYRFYSGTFLKTLPIPDAFFKEAEAISLIVNNILKVTEDSDYLANHNQQTKVKEYETQIDQMVYKLYGLTPEEITIVEKGK